MYRSRRGRGVDAGEDDGDVVDAGDAGGGRGGLGGGRGRGELSLSLL